MLLLGVVTVISVPAYIEFFLRRPVGEGPAGPVVPATDFEHPWSDRQVLLIGLGDSVTRGLGAKSPSHTYFARLQNNPDDEFADMRGKCLAEVLPNLSAENFAVSGSTSIEHLQTLQTQVPTYPDDVFGHGHADHRWQRPDPLLRSPATGRGSDVASSRNSKTVTSTMRMLASSQTLRAAPVLF